MATTTDVLHQALADTQAINAALRQQAAERDATIAGLTNQAADLQRQLDAAHRLIADQQAATDQRSVGAVMHDLLQNAKDSAGETWTESAGGSGPISDDAISTPDETTETEG